MRHGLTSGNANAQKAAVWAVYGLVCKAPASRVVIAAKPGCLAALAEVLKSNSAVDVKGLAAVALRLLPADSAAAVAADPGSTAGLVALLSSGRPDMQQAAADLLHGVVNKDPASRATAAAAPGCLAALTQVLNSNSASAVQGKMQAAGVLGLLALEHAAAVAAEPGCSEALVALLSSGSADLQRAAVQALSVMCRVDASRAAIVATPGCLAAVTSLLNNAGAVEVKIGAAGILEWLAVERAAAVAAEPDCIGGLVRLLNSGSADAQQAAVQALHCVMCRSETYPNSRAAIASTSGFPAALTSVLNNSLCNEETKRLAAVVLSLLPARYAAAVAAEPDCIVGLVALLSSGSTGLQEAALAALHFLVSKDVSSRIGVAKEQPAMPWRRCLSALVR